jgi:hypothetical protein
MDSWFCGAFIHYSRVFELNLCFRYRYHKFFKISYYVLFLLSAYVSVSIFLSDPNICGTRFARLNKNYLI